MDVFEQIEYDLRLLGEGDLIPFPGNKRPSRLPIGGASVHQFEPRKTPKRPASREPSNVAYIIIDHDELPDHSWLRQPQYDPNSPDYEPTFGPNGEIIDYHNPNKHVALEMLAYDAEGNIIDQLGNIDFMTDDDDWATGRFGHLRELNKYPYLRELAADMGLPD